MKKLTYVCVEINNLEDYIKVRLILELYSTRFHKSLPLEDFNSSYFFKGTIFLNSEGAIGYTKVDFSFFKDYSKLDLDYIYEKL